MMSLYRILRSVTLFTRLSIVQGRFGISTLISRTINFNPLDPIARQNVPLTVVHISNNIIVFA